MKRDLPHSMSPQKSRNTIYSDKRLSTQENLQSDTNLLKYHLNFASENISHHGNQKYDKNEGRNEDFDISRFLNLPNDDIFQAFAPQYSNDHQESSSSHINLSNYSNTGIQENKLFSPETEPNQKHNFNYTPKDTNCKNFWAILFKQFAKILKKNTKEQTEENQERNTQGNTEEDPQEVTCLIKDPKIKQLLQKLKKNTQNAKIKQLFENKNKTGSRNDLFHYIDNVQEMKIIILELFCNKKLLKYQQLLGRLDFINRRSYYRKLYYLKKQIIKHFQKLS